MAAGSSPRGRHFITNTVADQGSQKCLGTRSGSPGRRGGLLAHQQAVCCNLSTNFQSRATVATSAPSAGTMTTQRRELSEPDARNVSFRHTPQASILGVGSQDDLRLLVSSFRLVPFSRRASLAGRYCFEIPAGEYDCDGEEGCRVRCRDLAVCAVGDNQHQGGAEALVGDGDGTPIAFTTETMLTADDCMR